MIKSKSIPLWDAYGVELEYMLVREKDLAVAPRADELFFALTGSRCREIVYPDLSISNELALHVIELKTTHPVRNFVPLVTLIQNQLNKIDHSLARWGLTLLPTAAHPWMDPGTETRLWPNENQEIYEAFNRIFNCRGHGWSNLQSIHLNLPFQGNREFKKLHAAIRFLLPLLPALCASSPILERKTTGFLDTRLEFYRLNQRKIPSISGAVIPEPVYTMREYKKKILEKMYRDIAADDPQHLLQYEWLNSRGAIPRFDRNTIEIRILDIQECPLADFAILSLIIATLRSLTDGRWINLRRQCQWQTARLEKIFLNVVRDGEGAEIRDTEYLNALGYHEKRVCSAQRLWQKIFERVVQEGHVFPVAFKRALTLLLKEGTLSTRILKGLGQHYSKAKLFKIYQRLAECLKKGRMFQVASL